MTALTLSGELVTFFTLPTVTIFMPHIFLSDGNRVQSFDLFNIRKLLLIGHFWMAGSR